MSTPALNPFTPPTTNPHTIPPLYATHRTHRAQTQTTHLLTHRTIPPDHLLSSILSGAPDPRHNLTIWARPPKRIRTLIATIQTRVARLAGGKMWMHPAPSLHMTVLEIASGGSAAQIDAVVRAMTPVLAALEGVLAMKARGGRVGVLGQPRVMVDVGGLALSFVPRVVDVVSLGVGEGEVEVYSYQHLRRDVYDLVAPVVDVVARYVVPSAHVTIGRFVEGLEGEEVKRLVEVVEEVNGELEGEGVEWTVGEERGLEVRAGTCWYGFGGRTIALGQGIGEVEEEVEG